MATINPYASPETDEEPPLGVEYDVPDPCYRDGDLAVVPRISSLPARCVYCNEPSVRIRKRYRHLWLSLFGWTCQFVNFDYSICSKHVRQIAVGRAIDFVYVVPVIIFVVGDYFGVPMYVIIPAILITYIVINLLNRPACETPLAVKKVKRGKVWLVHCGKPFLESLPELQEEATEEV